MSKDKRRPLHTFDDIRDRESLAASGDAQQDLIFHALLEILDKLFDCRRLVAFGLIFRNETKLHTFIIQQTTRAKKPPIP